MRRHQSADRTVAELAVVLVYGYVLGIRTVRGRRVLSPIRIVCYLACCRTFGFHEQRRSQPVRIQIVQTTGVRLQWLPKSDGRAQSVGLHGRRHRHTGKPQTRFFFCLINYIILTYSEISCNTNDTTGVSGFLIPKVNIL